MSNHNQAASAKNYIGTREASFLLNISAVRMRQLLQQGRVEGAYKSGRRWLIPLKKGLPRITPGKRGPVGTWSRRRRQVNTRIHVNRQVLASNKKNGTNHPPISVRIGSKTHLCHEVDIPGNAKMIYKPHKSLPCGAVLWWEVPPDVVIAMKL